MNTEPVQIPTSSGHLSGIYHKVEASRLTVVIVPGQPQTRVGPHRLFVDIALHFEKQKINTLRFDPQGWGDSPGNRRSYSETWKDIQSVVSFVEQPVLLLGLCDGATASLLALSEGIECAGVILLNPFINDAQAESQAMLKSHYLPQLKKLPELFWRQIKSPAAIPQKIAEFAFHLLKKTEPEDGTSPTEKVKKQLCVLTQHSLLILSEKDLTANQAACFLTDTLNNHNYLSVKWLKGADHTFSSQVHKDILCHQLTEFLTSHPSYHATISNEA